MKKNMFHKRGLHVSARALARRNQRIIAPSRTTPADLPPLASVITAVKVNRTRDLDDQTLTERLAARKFVEVGKYSGLSDMDDVEHTHVPGMDEQRIRSRLKAPVFTTAVPESESSKKLRMSRPSALSSDVQDQDDDVSLSSRIAASSIMDDSRSRDGSERVAQDVMDRFDQDVKEYLDQDKHLHEKVKEHLDQELNQAPSVQNTELPRVLEQENRSGIETGDSPIPSPQPIPLHGIDHGAKAAASREAEMSQMKKDRAVAQLKARDMIQELYEMAEDIRETENSPELHEAQEKDWYIGSAFNAIEGTSVDDHESNGENVPRWLKTAQMAEDRSRGMDNEDGEISAEEMAQSGGRLTLDHILNALYSEKGRDIVS
jgi:hypothetical protein